MTSSARPQSLDTDADDNGARFAMTPQRIRLLGIAGAVVLVVALAIWFTITAGRRKEVFAARALEQARITAQQGNLPVAVQEFERVVSTYGGTGAANDATIGIAQARLILGQNELAISSLETFLKQNPEATYRSPAQVLLGTAYENTKKFSEAAAAYRKAADDASGDYLKGTALLNAGRALRLAGKRDDAVAVYREIIAKYGETPAKTEAEVRLAELTKGLM